MKVECSSEACNLLQNKLAICATSQTIPGRLGQQLICLLSGMIDGSVFLELQQEHFNNLRDALTKTQEMAWVLALGRNQQAWQCFHNLLQQENHHHCKRLYDKCTSAVLQE